MSLTDLGVRLYKASRHSGWSSRLLQATLTELAEALHGSAVDYDEDAGEEWGRLLVGDDVVAILWLRGAFALVQQEFSDLVPRLTSAGVIVEIVSDWDAPLFTIEPEDLRLLFGRETISDAVNPARLSANELWWATT